MTKAEIPLKFGSIEAPFLDAAEITKEFLMFLKAFLEQVYPQATSVVDALEITIDTLPESLEDL